MQMRTGTHSCTRSCLCLNVSSVPSPSLPHPHPQQRHNDVTMPRRLAALALSVESVDNADVG